MHQVGAAQPGDKQHGRCHHHVRHDHLFIHGLYVEKLVWLFEAVVVWDSRRACGAAGWRFDSSGCARCFGLAAPAGRREGGREGLLLFTWPLQRMSLKHTCSSVEPGRVRCRQNKSVLLFVVKVILVSYEAQVFRHHGRINLPGDPRGRNDLWAPQITSESNIKLLCVCSCLCCHSSTTLVGLHRSFNRPYSHLLPARSVSECRRQICASTLFVFLHQSVFTGLW